MKVYIKYIIKNFVKLLFIISSIFFILVLLLNLLQELDFFKNTNESLYYPLLLNILNAPSILINISLQHPSDPSFHIHFTNHISI